MRRTRHALASAACAPAWREELSAERIRRVDTLTYLLGKYRAPPAARPPPARRRKAARLEALSPGRAAADAPTAAGDGVRPHTPLAEARRMAERWLAAADARAAEAEEGAAAASGEVPALIADEAEVLLRFGMMAAAAPPDARVPPIDAVFRQTWRDFEVTEIPAGGTEPLSRAFSFAVPPLPAALRPESPGGPAPPADAASFFQVDVASSLRAISDSAAAEEKNGGGGGGGAARGRFQLQCTLHKQNVAHSTALAELSRVLHIHPNDVSAAGIKDYVGDTVQHVRIANVSPASALEANRQLAQRGVRVTLSDFSYEAVPLQPGNLAGNHFRVVLREVRAPRETVERAMHNFRTHGFPNYYGCQRFSWFGGRDDAGFALLRHNWLAFAFRFLNYTADPALTLRALLQRELKYPHPAQDEYRRRVVRRLRALGIAPAELDAPPFLSCPPAEAPVTAADGAPLGRVQELVLLQLREAFFDLEPQSRRLTAQKVSSYCWNQALSLRLQRCGGARVLPGDLVAPAAMRRLACDGDGRRDYYRQAAPVGAAEAAAASVEDVLHPGFSFDGIALPRNEVGDIYRAVCRKYALDWAFPHTRLGLRDFREPPRPIVRRPQRLRYAYDAAGGVLTVSFALERGCYANVALTEMLGGARCLGAEQVRTLPLPTALWAGLGERDAGYVTSLQDVYEGFEDGVGFTADAHETPAAAGAEARVWDHAGPLFLPPAQDPKRRAFRWGRTHLLRNAARRAQDAQRHRRTLFERPLADALSEEEEGRYVGGHAVPLPPNAKRKRMFFRVLRRRSRYAGAPRQRARFSRKDYAGASKQRLPAFQTLNKNSWNVSW